MRDIEWDACLNLQLAFSRFAPSEVVERVIASGLSDIGEKKEVTVLFSDLVGFTALSETVEPAVLVRILNGYFERMSGAISRHRGYVSTFVGDGILAFFGALAPWRCAGRWRRTTASWSGTACRPSRSASASSGAAVWRGWLEVGI